MTTHTGAETMDDRELLRMLVGLNGDVGQLTGEVRRLAAGQTPPSTIAELEVGQETLQEPVRNLEASLRHRGEQLKAVHAAQTALMAAEEEYRKVFAEGMRDLRNLIVFVHKDLREHIDARLGGAGATG